MRTKKSEASYLEAVGDFIYRLDQYYRQKSLALAIAVALMPILVFTIFIGRIPATSGPVFIYVGSICAVIVSTLLVMLLNKNLSGEHKVLKDSARWIPREFDAIYTSNTLFPDNCFLVFNSGKVDEECCMLAYEEGLWRILNKYRQIDIVHLPPDGFSRDLNFALWGPRDIKSSQRASRLKVNFTLTFPRLSSAIGENWILAYTSLSLKEFDRIQIPRDAFHSILGGCVEDCSQLIVVSSIEDLSAIHGKIADELNPLVNQGLLASWKITVEYTKPTGVDGHTTYVESYANTTTSELVGPK